MNPSIYLNHFVWNQFKDILRLKKQFPATLFHRLLKLYRRSSILDRKLYLNYIVTACISQTSISSQNSIMYSTNNFTSTKQSSVVSFTSQKIKSQVPPWSYVSFLDLRTALKIHLRQLLSKTIYHLQPFRPSLKWSTDMDQLVYPTKTIWRIKCQSMSWDLLI